MQGDKLISKGPLEDNMDVKMGQPLLPTSTNPTVPVTLEPTPAYLATRRAAPFRFVSPLEASQSPPPVIVAAVQIQPAPLRRSERAIAAALEADPVFPSSAAEEKFVVLSKKMASSNKNKRKAPEPPPAVEMEIPIFPLFKVRFRPALRNPIIDPKVAKVLDETSPFKQVVLEDIDNLDVPTTAPAEIVDVVLLLRKEMRRRQREATRQRQRHELAAAEKAAADKALADARVVLKVLTAAGQGQLPLQAKTPSEKALQQLHRYQQKRQESPATQGKPPLPSSSKREKLPISKPVRNPPNVPRNAPTATVATKLSAQNYGRKTPTILEDSVEWHPGMHSAYGISYVNPVVAAAATAKPPPPVFSGAPSRCTDMPLRSEDIPSFSSEDPLKASLEYLHYLATSVGRLPQFPPRLQQTFNTQQRMHRERLSRMLTARDGRRLVNDRQHGTRRSGRTRFAPDVFKPVVAGGDDGRASVYGAAGRPNRSGKETDEEEMDVVMKEVDPAEATDVRMGPEFQVNLPAVRPRPTMPSTEELARCGEVVVSAGAAPLPPRGADEGVLARQWDRERRALALSGESARLTAVLGPEVGAALGLMSMGVAMAGELDTEQQEALYAGMKEHGRDFHAMTKDHLPGVAPRRLAAYYYDVWKLRGVPAAEQWYADRKAEAVLKEAAEKEAEKVRLEEAAKRAERQEASARRRQVKEAVAWVRLAAKGPDHVNFNKPIVRERALRVVGVRILAANSAPQVQKEIPVV